MGKLEFEGYMRLIENGGPYSIMLRDEAVYHDDDLWSGNGPDDKMIRPRTKETDLAELIGKVLLQLPVVHSYGEWRSVLDKRIYECGKVRIVIERVEEVLG